MDALKSVQPVVDAFYQAINLRQLTRAEELLNQLREQAQTQPALGPWCHHYAAVLLTEHNQDWAQAERIFSEILGAAAPVEPLLKGKTLLELGICLHYQGQWLESVRVCEESLPILATVGELSDQAFVYKQIAINYRYGFLNGDLGVTALQQALLTCQQALDILARVENPPGYVIDFQGVMTNLLGELHSDLEQWDKAIGCFESFLHTSQTLNDSFGMSMATNNLGEVYERLGSAFWTKAIDAYQKAWSTLQTVEGGHTHKVAEFERSRAYYGQAIDAIEALRASASSELARTGFFAVVAQIYALQTLVCLDMHDVAEAFNTTERARARAFLDVLASGSIDLPSQFAANIYTLSEVQAALPADALLLSYFTTGLLEVDERRKQTAQQPKRYRFPPAKTLIFAVTREQFFAFDAGLSPNDLRPRELDNLVECHFLAPNIRRLLYDKLIQPVALLLQDKQRIYVIPHGPLHYIPFHALLAADGNTLARLDGPEIVYAPSASLLFSQAKLPAARGARPCLAVGYNGEANTRLRFAEEESRLIAHMLAGEALVGSGLSRLTLNQQAADVRLLHFSCHGAFDPVSPLLSALHIAAGEGLTGQYILESMTLCCDLVVLSACESGLNRVRRGDELFGLLRALMVAGARAVLASL
ncbi:MAG TPA: CHAT domain-containing protein, partial [Caldilineaceae bacterium]|nr:CHAT domain-containing protein [Caldilineaceae bacterium]